MHWPAKQHQRPERPQETSEVDDHMILFMVQTRGLKRARISSVQTPIQWMALDNVKCNRNFGLNCTSIGFIAFSTDQDFPHSHSYQTTVIKFQISVILHIYFKQFKSHPDRFISNTPAALHYNVEKDNLLK